MQGLNPNWQKAGQLSIYKRGRGCYLLLLELLLNNSSGWSEGRGRQGGLAWYRRLMVRNISFSMTESNILVFSMVDDQRRHILKISFQYLASVLGMDHLLETVSDLKQQEIFSLIVAKERMNNMTGYTTVQCQMLSVSWLNLNPFRPSSDYPSTLPPLKFQSQRKPKFLS